MTGRTRATRSSQEYAKDEKNAKRKARFAFCMILSSAETMADSLQGKVVLITGASSGFGEDAARLFAKEGCKVVLAARRLEKLQQMAADIHSEGGEAFATPVDVNEGAEINVMVQTVLDRYG